MTTYSQPKPAGAPTWVDLTTPEIEAARGFYHAIFGWDYDIGGPEFGGYTTARLGQRTTAGLSPNQPDAPSAPATWGLYFASDNIEADVARAVELGANVLYPPMVVGEFGGMAGCVDPTGAAFSFWQAGQHIGSQVTDESGATTWHEMYASDAKKARDFYMALLGATADPMPGGLGIMCSSTARRCWPGSCKSIPRGATFARSGSPISRWPTPMRPRRL
ncbi:MAG: VOC family protein [Caldilineales bacterium]|nr:VOC family protein [Caldilineales bacterium]